MRHCELANDITLAIRGILVALPFDMKATIKNTVTNQYYLNKHIEACESPRGFESAILGLAKALEDYALTHRMEERERREKLARKLVRVRRVYLDSQGYITNKGSYGVGYLHDYRGIGQKVWCVFINDEPICEVRAEDKEHAKLLAYRDSYVRSTIIRMENAQ